MEAGDMGGGKGHWIAFNSVCSKGGGGKSTQCAVVCACVRA